MSFHNILTDPAAVRIALFSIAGLAAIAAFVARFIQQKRHPEPRVIRLTIEPSAQPLVANVEPAQQARETDGAVESTPALSSPGVSAARAQPEPPPCSPQVETAEIMHVAPARDPEILPAPPQADELPAVHAEASTGVSPALRSILTLQERSPISMDILRGALIMIAIAVAAALLLVVMPQSGVDRVATALRPRNAPGPPPEKIAFLYLGDEVREGQFHIRGVIRNITSQPIEQLQAVIRLYAPDRTLLETQVVRMDSETVFPNATASFHLSFSDYHGQFGSYSLDFKLAQGDPVLYKDTRETRASS